MTATRRERFDIVVIGGGAAGVAAAVSAARLGAKTALVERYGFLGGAATNSLILTYDGFFYRRPRPEWAIGGIGRELLDRLEKFENKVAPILSSNGNWVVPFNPESAKAAFDDLVIEAKVSVRMHAMLVDARRVADRIEAVVVADHAGRFEIAADSFVDASGEGDLAALAGAPMAERDPAKQAASLCARIGGIARDVKIDSVTLTNVCAAVPSAERPATLRANGGFLLRLEENDDFWWMGTDISTDGLSSESLTQAEQNCRATAWAFIRRLRSVPGCERATLVATGAQLGIRETRHPMARYMLSEAEATEGRRATTAIGRAAWQMERHDAPGRPSLAFIGGDGFFDIPADATRCAEIENLWLGGRTIGADRGAFSSLRVMGTAFAIGQAAGAAAALAARGTTDYVALRQALLDQGAIL
ncbi:MAG TPA: FAD-dependent oxidoreductase [Telmatospirillum sp.]|nr:FAD-dependent oxidoreductase [Telmatospirillum sp.]